MQRKFEFAAALLSVAVAGCGGAGSSNPAPTAGGENGTRTIDTQTGTDPTGGSSAPGTVTSTTVTLASGGSATAGIPGGVTIPAGDAVLLVPSEFFIDLEPVAGGDGIVRKPAEPVGLTSGEIYLCSGPNFTAPVDTGLMVGTGGVIVPATGGTAFSFYALPYPTASPGTDSWFFEIAGPVQVGAAPGNFLNISSGLFFTFVTSNGGILGAGLQNTYPNYATYSLPANGQALNGSYLRLNTPGTATSNSLPTSMQVNWPGKSIGQTHTLTDDTVTLFKAVNLNLDIVPPTGITNAYLYLPNTQ